MATSLTLSTPKTDNPTTRPIEGEAKPAMEFAKSSNKGRKPNGKAPYPKKQPQRGMGVAQLEHLRKMSETRTTTTVTQFPCETIGGAGNIPVLHGVANYGVPMVINDGNGGFWGWGGETDGLMMQRVVGNGGFGGFNGQLLVGNPGNLQVGIVDASKELSSIPKFQHFCVFGFSVCFLRKHERKKGRLFWAVFYCHLTGSLLYMLQKKRCNVETETGKFNGGILNQFGQIFPRKEVDFHGWNLENNQNHTNGEMNGFSSRAARSAYAYAATGQMNNTSKTVDVLAIHKKVNSAGTGSYVMEYEFFPGKNGRNTASNEWELPQEGSFSFGDEASHANASNCVDLSLKLSY
ncbi:Met-10+ like family protein isoform 1 [Hibiscus syriacus]|uniref:Met-10+ like family protein isoform 1 n=1 Tax=Hibiscus syriacus TaxID=106335 RepID=A0A6A3AJZ4_HIBSY|nr:Met-10+ like family protein isoform 1 [Hibiscus syriacus]